MIDAALPQGPGPTLEALAAIHEIQIWLQKHQSAHTRRAYLRDLQHFLRTSRLATLEDIRHADHNAVIAWERHMRESEHAEKSTIRRRLAALSSFYKDLIRNGFAARNPAADVERPPISRIKGSTLAFSQTQARQLLDAPEQDNLAGLRDRAILSVGLEVGLRRAQIAALTVGDLNQNQGYDSLRIKGQGIKGQGEIFLTLTINAQTAARLRSYLEASGHAGDIDGPLFRPLRHNGKRREERRRMDPDAIDRVVRKFAAALGLERRYSAHSMRATFATTALANGAPLEEVQRALGHRDPSSTARYARRDHNPQKAASFFATYDEHKMKLCGPIIDRTSS